MNISILENFTFENFTFEKICYSLPECTDLCKYSQSSDLFILIMFIFTFSYFIFKIGSHFTEKYFKTDINYLYGESVNIISFIILLFFTENYLYLGLFFILALIYKIIKRKSYSKYINR